MTFKIIDSNNLENLTTISIIDYISLEDFLQMKTKLKNIILCPTNAIDIEKKEISKKCIDCGICWVNNKYKIERSKIISDYLNFESYILKEKMFVYRWFSLILLDYSGINIKSKGFSRTKRIPLIIKKDKVLYIFKSIRDVADLDKANYELDDIIDLIKEKIKEYKIIKVIITIKNSKETRQSNKVKIIKLVDIYDKMSQKGKITIKELVGS